MCKNAEVFVASILQITGTIINNDALFYSNNIFNNQLK